MPGVGAERIGAGPFRRVRHHVAGAGPVSRDAECERTALVEVLDPFADRSRARF